MQNNKIEVFHKSISQIFLYWYLLNVWYIEIENIFAFCVFQLPTETLALVDSTLDLLGVPQTIRQLEDLSVSIDYDPMEAYDIMKVDIHNFWSILKLKAINTKSQ